MSARREVGLALVCVLATTGFGTYAVFAAGGKADFSIAASPASQTVSQGQAATYTVGVTRVNGFTGSVTLETGKLPTGATASWKLGNGTSSNVVPSNLNSATLTIQTSASTPVASSKLGITGTSGNLAHETTVTLVVQPPDQPNFTVTASPASQTVIQGDTTSYRLDVSRSGSFSGPVTLKINDLPSGLQESWSPSNVVPGDSSSATLALVADGNAQTGTYTLEVKGTGMVGASTVTRIAAVTLIVEAPRSFQIEGHLDSPLSPGTVAPLNLSLTNPYNFDLRITNLAVAVEEHTTEPGCSGTENFSVIPVPASRYPITLPAGATRTLDALGVADSDKPRIEMIDHSWNQDVCMGATLTLDYNGTAGK